MQFKNSKKGQVADTATWMMATLIIIFVLVVSVYAASLLSTAIKTVKIDFSFEKKTDFLVRESLFAYLLTKDGDKNIYKKIDESKNIDVFSLNLATGIFEKTHENTFTLELRNPGDFSIGTYEKIKISDDSELRLFLKNDGGT